MVFRSFDRLVYVAMENAEGVNAFDISGSATAEGATSLANQPDAADYIETIDPTFSITNRVYDRNPTRRSITPAPKTVTGRGSAALYPSATCEISFSVELAGAGIDSAACVEPRWAKLLTCCGMEQYTIKSIGKTAVLTAAGGASAPAPYRLRNREVLSSALASGSPTAFSAGAAIGRSFGGVAYHDTEIYYYLNDSPPATPATAHRIFGQATDVWAGTSANQGPFALTNSGIHTNTSIGWIPTSTSRLGGATSASDTLGGSCSIILVLSDTNQFINVVGCRGNVEFACTSGDRVLMNFTMTGKVMMYGDTGLTSTPSTTGVEQPPAFVNTSMSLYESSYGATSDTARYTDSIFNSLTVSLNNDVTLRENVSNSTGYDCSYITGRSSMMSFNPDAKVMSTSYDIWDRFLSGEQTDMINTIGTAAGNKFTLRVPYAQFDGIADGNRDEVMVFDSTTNATGGDMGESIQQTFDTAESATLADSSNILDPRLGTNNEFHLILHGNA